MRSFKLLLTLLVLASACTTSTPAASVKTPDFKVDEKLFEASDACFLIYDLKNEKLVKVYGEARCKERYVACSTFKMPLAMMALDAGVIQDENTPFKWNKTHYSMDSWNRDQTASSWMKNSVVWVSQQITPKLGKSKIQEYLKKFNYGNQDFSAGLRSSWLTATKTSHDKANGSLQITAFEQLEFLKHFWKHEFPISQHAWDKTKQITFLETSPQGFDLYGKTGSGYLKGLTGDFGWFIGRIEGKGQEYLMVTTFTRKGQAADAKYPGPRAKEITKAILSENSLF